jgi:hypothetical protein
MTKWEYEVVRDQSFASVEEAISGLQELLTSCGEDGWRLIPSQISGILIFEREVKSVGEYITGLSEGVPFYRETAPREVLEEYHRNLNKKG